MLKELIRFTELADEKMIEVFESTANEIPQAEHLFSHILNAQHIWLSRINGTKQEFERFDARPKALFREIYQSNFSKLKEVLALKSPDTIINYTMLPEMLLVIGCRMFCST